MEIVLFTVVAIFLYLLSDWIVQRIELSMGRRMEYRTLVFFAVITVLAFTSFTFIRTWVMSS